MRERGILKSSLVVILINELKFALYYIIDRLYLQLFVRTSLMRKLPNMLFIFYRQSKYYFRNILELVTNEMLT